MLGFAPVSGRSVSGSPFSLVAVAASIVVSASITFTVTAFSGLHVPASSTITIQFPVTASILPRQAITDVTVGINFDLSATVRDYGKPIRLRAVPEVFTLNAMKESFGLKAMSESFDLRGAR